MTTRRERVILQLQDDLSPGMLKAAAATQVLDKAIHGLDGSAVRIERPLHSAAVETDRVSTSAGRAGPEIDRLSGRLRLLARTAAILGPSLVPIGAVGIPAITGLASQLGFAAIGAGSLVTAFQGVGDALKAVNDAALDPTAANLEKAQAAMAQLGPDAQAFVQRFQELRPVLRDIRDASAAGWFPGLTESMDDFQRIAPQVADLFENIGRVGGGLISEGMAAFAGPEWDDFRSMIATEAPRMLDDLGRTIGNLVAGLAHLWQAFTPLNSDFSEWLLDASRSFSQWADGLSQTEGFNEFVDYIRTNGPRVADALAAVADAVLEIIEAVAPLGGPSLKIIETFAEVIGAIADSPLGTPLMAGVAAMSALSTATTVATAALTRFRAAQAAVVGTSAASTGAGAAAAAGPLGLPALAVLYGGLNAGSNLKAGAEGNRGLGEGLLRSVVPGLYGLDMLGVKVPGLSGDTSGMNGLDMLNMTREISANAEAAQKATAAQIGLSGATASVAEKAGFSASEISNYTNALDAHVDAALGAFNAETQWRDSLAAARELAAENEAGIDGMSEAARANRTAIANLASAWNAQRDAMVENGASAGQVARKHAEMRRQFIDVAKQMGINEARAERLADQYLKIPTKVATKILLDGISKASDDIAKLARQIAAVPKNPTITFRVNKVGDVPKGSIGQTPNNPSMKDLLGGSADGGFVPKTGLPYADRHLYMLADGEGITTNRRGETDRFRDVIGGINAGMTRAQVKGMLADGGFADRFGAIAQAPPPVQQQSPSSYAPTVTVDLSPLERRMAAVERAVHANTADRGAQTDKKIKADRYGASNAARSWVRGGS